MGVYILLAVRVGRVFPGGSGLAIAMVAGAVVVAPMGIAQGGSELLQPELLAAGAAVALASSVIPYSLDLEALRRLPARVFGVLMSLEPAVAALAGLVVLGQELGAREWAAIALVVSRAGSRGDGERLGRRARREGRRQLLVGSRTSSVSSSAWAPQSPPRSAAAHAAPRAAGGG